MRDLGFDASTNWFVADESAGVCGTVYDRSGLAEEAAGQAAERREENWSTMDCCDGMMLLFLVALAIAAVAGGKHLA